MVLFTIRIQPNPRTKRGYDIITSFSITQDSNSIINKLFFENLCYTFKSLGLTYELKTVSATVKRVIITGACMVGTDHAGAKNMQLFMSLLEKEETITSGDRIYLPFFGRRLRDYLIIKEIEQMRKDKTLNTEEGYARAVYYRYNLHKTNYKTNYNEQLDINEHCIPFPEACVKYFKDNSTIIKTKYKDKNLNFLKQLDEKVEKIHDEIYEAMSTNNLEINPFWITGFVEGDGGLNPSVPIGPGTIRFRVSFALSAAIYNIILLEVTQYFFRKTDWKEQELLKSKDFISQATFVERAQKPNRRKINASLFSLRYSSTVFFKNVLIPHFLKYGMETEKNLSFLLCVDIIKAKYIDQNIQEPEQIKKLIDDIYNVHTSHGGNQNKRPKKELEEAVNTVFNKIVFEPTEAQNEMEAFD